jgi:hypothetical protein
LNGEFARQLDRTLPALPPSGRRHVGSSRGHLCRACEAFFTHLAVPRRVAASTQNQALSALVFLFRDALRREIGRAVAVRVSRPTCAKSESDPALRHQGRDIGANPGRAAERQHAFSTGDFRAAALQDQSLAARPTSAANAKSEDLTLAPGLDSPPSPFGLSWMAQMTGAAFQSRAVPPKRPRDPQAACAQAASHYPRRR